MIKWHPYPQVEPQENGNYIVAVEFDNDLIVVTDYWFYGRWDDDDGDVSRVIGWAELPTLKAFKKILADGKRERVISEYNSVVQAVDVIRSFLNTHESNYSTTCFWKSDIDGTILKTDWGYFEEGLDEIRDYCVRLDADRKTEPQTDEKMEYIESVFGNVFHRKDEPQTDCQ